MNNQGLGKCNLPWPPASADYTCLDLDYSRYHKNLIQLLFIIIIIIIIIDLFYVINFILILNYLADVIKVALSYIPVITD